MNNNFYKLNGSKYPINHDFFKNINTEIQAYLLGFYVADGNINKKRKTFRVKVSAEDREIPELYKTFISPEAKLIKYEGYEIEGRGGKKYQGNDQIAIDINSAKLVESLVDLNYGYNKTYDNLRLPKLSDDLMVHFIRGFFDGDGSISVYVAKEKGKKDRVRCSMSLCAKNNSILDDISKFFSKFKIKTNVNYLKRDDMYRLATSSKAEILKIYNLIYKGCNYSLKRKLNSIESYVNTEILPKTKEDCNA
jgi:hypothetical protein